MGRYLERLERWYFRYADYVPRVLLGVMVAFWVGNLVADNSYALPAGWAQLTPLVLVGLFLAGESIGVLGTLFLLGWMLYNTWSVVGVLAGVLWLLMLGPAYLLVTILLPTVLRHLSGPRGHGRLSLLVLSPFLVNANLGFVVPLAAGLNWGGAGPGTAVMGALISSVFFILQGAHFWAFPIPAGHSIFEVTIPSAQNPVGAILGGLPPLLRPYLEPIVNSLAAQTQGLWKQVADYKLLSQVWGQTLQLLRDQLLYQPAFVFQILLWGATAFAMSSIVNNRTSTGARLVAVAVGMAMLGAGYRYIRLPAAVGAAPSWPGGAALFWYYMIVSAAIVLLPKLLITGRYAPGSEPQRVVLVTQPRVGARIEGRVEEQIPATLLTPPEASSPEGPAAERGEASRPRVRKIEL